MAEAIAIVGVVAAAAQFTDTGSRLVLRLTSLFSRIRDGPRCLELTLEQLQMLLGLAELTEKRITAENNSCLPPVAESLESDQAPTLQSLQASNLTWLESAWRSCTAQACELDNLVRQMLQETERSTFRKGWRKLCTLKNEEEIERVLTRIERSKTLLSTWYGQECLDRIKCLSLNLVDLQGEVSGLRQSMVHFSETFQRLLPAPALEPRGHLLGSLQQHQYRATSPFSLRVLDMIQDQGRQSFQTRQQTQSLKTTVIQEVRSDTQTLSKSRANMAWRKELDTSGSGGVGANTISASVLRYPGSSRPSRCECRSSNWHKVYWSSRIMGQHCSNISDDCPLHRKRKRSSEIAIRFRQQVPFTVTVLEGTLEIYQSSVYPSVGISLRTEARVKVLPLESFFRRLYLCHLGVKTTSRHQDPVERQDYLLSVAQRMLLKSFSSGDASPDDVDSQGRTLLHQQIELYHQGDEPFVARMIRMLLSMGVRADMLNDEFRTAQQVLAEKLSYHKSNERFLTHPLTIIGDELLDWTGCQFSDDISVSGILDCINRWPESISEWGYPRICDIVLRKSINNLKYYLQGSAPVIEWTPRQLTPLHFATAADWLEGVTILLESGADEYAQDSKGHMALDIAISIQSASLVKIFLASDIKPYIILTKRKYQKTTLGPGFLLAAESSNEALQDVVVDALARQRGQLHGLRPFHDLAKIQGSQSSLFAEKLYSAGFRNVEQYDESGMTPLMVACYLGTMSMASFLLSHGAKVSTEHRDTALRPGHFLIYVDSTWHIGIYHGRSGDKLHHSQETKLLEASFKSADSIDSICRCSPEGFSPLTAMYRPVTGECSYLMKQGFEVMLNYLNPQHIDISRQWRCLVALEVFDRLEMTHTCIHHLPIVSTFPEEDRMEIEEEEEEIFVEFESIMDRYDQLRKNFVGPTAKCVEKFFNELDHDLRPLQGFHFSSLLWNDEGADILAPGLRFVSYWVSTNGQRFRYGHDEGVGESCLLGSIFD